MKFITYLKNHLRQTISVILVITAIFLLTTIYYSIAPNNFPKREILVIKQGVYLADVANILKEKNIIKSTILFKVYLMLSSGHRQVVSGNYLFDKPQSSLKVASRIATGAQGLPKIKITIFEGMTTKDIGVAIKKNIPNFDINTFNLLAKQYEGYLFPDTYFFYENVTPDEVINVLRNTFNQKIKSNLLLLQTFGKSIKDVVIMASIVEKEATSSIDRRIISGILWKRIDMGMPLQVDPPFYYFLNKDSSQITLKDLAIDSPYNTYKNKGLPPTPIDNPGIDAILDTINPTKTKYLFYLSDKKGNMHYSPNYEGHLVNKKKYL